MNPIAVLLAAPLFTATHDVVLGLTSIGISSILRLVHTLHSAVNKLPSLWNRNADQDTRIRAQRQIFVTSLWLRLKLRDTRLCAVSFQVVTVDRYHYAG